MSHDITKYVGQQIRKFRKAKKLTQKELGLKIGVKHNTISSYENGTNEPDQDMIFAIAHALEVNINDFFPDINEKPSYKPTEDRDNLEINETFTDYMGINNQFKSEHSYKAFNFIRLPIYGQISCGNGRIIFEDPIDFEDVPRDWLNGGEYIMLIAQGDSMTGSKIFEGDKLLIRKQSEVENGEIAAVVVGEETLLKKVYKKGNTLILESSNDKYETRVLDLNEVKNVQILGKLKKSVTTF
ncbi:LexA repressor [Planococcus massiliensis]|uniref:LexA repressor n=1 Tax=Planococcus massiliensis TaxID=1499687 RepID=A0A098ELK1_9BACL|nr:XRE family transcriptional regulator [Planococcus massiliensis]CEG23168.1 LexA repressor [Planococcus massiliensis]